MASTKKRVLVVDDDPMLRELIAKIMSDNGYEVDLAANGKEALKQVEGRLYEHIITDINMPVMDGLALLKKLDEKDINANVIVISAHTEMANVVRAFKLGASDFISKPLQSEDEILLTIRKVEDKARLQKENIRLRQEVENKYTFANIVAKSRSMLEIFKIISKIADYKTSVLITGESGTGKEMIAKAIHYNSNRKKKPLIDINCGGIPETLLESELFGFEKGAFTDAYRSKKGLFVEADGGTLFLDELGELPMALQVKLLRALQEEKIRPLGGSESTQVDVRILAATARNLREEVQQGSFREDLFYRINVLTIEIPPLRARQEDIPLLIDHFITKYNSRLHLNIEKVESDCMQKLLTYSWPGNVRELENIIERSMALSDGSVLLAENLPQEITRYADQPTGDFFSSGYSIKKNVKVLEKQLIVKALEETSGNKTRASELLELSLPALLYKIKEFQL